MSRYGSAVSYKVWAATLAQLLLLASWKTLPLTHTATLVKLGVFSGALLVVGLAAYRGVLPRTRPILPGEWMVSD